MAEETILAKNVQKLLWFRLSSFSFLHLFNVSNDYYAKYVCTGWQSISDQKYGSTVASFWILVTF